MTRIVTMGTKDDHTVRVIEDTNRREVKVVEYDHLMQSNLLATFGAGGGIGDAFDNCRAYTDARFPGYGLDYTARGAEFYAV